MAGLQRKNGRVKTPQRRFCARRLDRSSAKKRSHGSGIPASADICQLFSNPYLMGGFEVMMVFGGRKRSYSSMYGWHPPQTQTTNEEQDPESLIVKLEYFGQLLAVLGEGLQFSAASIAYRELQREEVTEDPDENGINGDIPLPTGLDEPNGNPNSSSNSDTDAKIEALQQQIAELERRLDKRE
ncbi:hypothetical protein [Salicibibacter cibarius]|nr:hypothetical protein [Salicibibacter cibarius]